MHRRRFLQAAGCGCLACLVGRDVAAQETVVDTVSDEEWFLCATPSIVDLTVIDDAAGSGTGPVIDEAAEGSGAPELDEYAIARERLRWLPDDGIRNDRGIVVLGIVFLDGTPWQKDAVRTHAREWLAHDIPIDFVFNNPSATNIRISFGTGKNISAVGRSAKGYPIDSPTMELADVRQTSSANRVRHVVLHEFGHGAMTLGHEHKHPDAGIRWVPEAIARDTGWSAGDIENQITNAFDRSFICAASKEYHPESIMQYPIKRDWVRNGRVVPMNTELSERV